MSRWVEALVACVAAFCATGVAAQERYPGIGRLATPAEIRAWDIDVRPDFKGLPAGSGSVSKGRDVWDAKCASCHGTFGESNEVFTPIIGGTTKEDVKTGRVKALTNPETPRTTLMKLGTISTLWDYINRAMPWTAPKTLTIEEVYAVTAYILNLGDLVPDDFVLSDRNMAEVQKLLPNRDGFTRDHGLWDIRGKPDVKNVACMKNCAGEVQVVSQLPEIAKDAHGNLAAQNRTFGPVRGIQTVSAKLPQAPQAKPAADPKAMATSAGCLACHGVSTKSVGPAFTEIASKYGKDSDAHAKLIAKVKAGGAGAWGSVPMPPQPQLKDDELKAMVGWILNGAK
jgi:cytochrome c